MLCRACGRAPARPKACRGPAPTLCLDCAADSHRTRSRDAEPAIVARIEARQSRLAGAQRAAPCTCAALIVRVEGPLLVCGLCSRVIAGQAVAE